MFAGWDSFYLLIGGAAGALLGLLFVVATLASSQDRTAALRGASIYVSPLVFHLGVVVAASGVALAPHLPPHVVAGLLGLAAAAGFAQAVRIAVSILSPKGVNAPHWSDLWCYGVAVGAAYLTLAAAAWGVGARAAWAAEAVAAALLALLLVTIRNAWDLVTWLALGPGPPPPAA